MIRVQTFGAQAIDPIEAAAAAAKRFNDEIDWTKPIDVISITQQSGYNPNPETAADAAWSVITIVYRPLVQA